MKLNRFSMFAIGAAVLTLSACTEADQFDTYTKDGKKYITTINVSNVTPELGTRTYFDTSDGNYGKVYWENGAEFPYPTPDELYFYEVNNSTCSNVFICETPAESFQDPYGRASFKTKWQDNGLAVPNNYYAYYFPGYTNHYYNNVMPLDQWEWQGDDDDALRAFLRSYDFLKPEESHHSGGYINITGSNSTIYMDHFFSLIIIDLNYDSDYKQYPLKPTGDEPYFNRVTISTKNENAFGNKLMVNANGVMKTDAATNSISLRRTDNQSDLTLGREKRLLRYFFVVENKDGMKDLTINFICAGDPNNSKGVTFTGKMDNNVLVEPIKFNAGMCYHLEFKTECYDMHPYDVEHWQQSGSIEVLTTDTHLHNMGLWRQ